MLLNGLGRLSVVFCCFPIPQTVEYILACLDTLRIFAVTNTTAIKHSCVGLLVVM